MLDAGWVGRVAGMEKGNAKPAPDWEKIEADYRAGVLSLREIADANPGVNHVAIARRAKRDGWSRDLSAKIRAKADALVTERTVTADVTAKRTSLGNLRYPRARYPRRYPPNTWFAGNQGF